MNYKANLTVKACNKIGLDHQSKQYEPQHDKTNKMIGAPNEDSAQPDLSLGTSHFVGFVMPWLI